MMEQQKEIHRSTIIVEDFNTHLLGIANQAGRKSVRILDLKSPAGLQGKQTFPLSLISLTSLFRVLFL